MHRQPLLQALDAYAVRYPEEADTVARFREFVRGYRDCFQRELAAPGHVTGSAWIVAPDGASVLLMHHRKLDLWIQLGGHADGDPRPWQVAEREGLEESGLPTLQRLTVAGVGRSEEDLAAAPIPFDLDIHSIPARKGEPEHLHFDVRYAFRAPSLDVRGNAESRALAWVSMRDLPGITEDASVMRMAAKWARLQADEIAVPSKTPA